MIKLGILDPTCNTSSMCALVGLPKARCSLKLVRRVAGHWSAIVHGLHCSL